jgi:DNA-binding response OmpR family regulator
VLDFSIRVHGAAMKRRVLLVDDDATVLLTLKAVLELHHFDVETAATVKEAREKLCRHEYDVVVTDVRMESDESGFEVLRTARAQSYQPATAILTAYPLQNEQWKKQEAESFLVKPIGTKQLVEQLEALIARRADTLQRERRGSAS